MQNSCIPPINVIIHTKEGHPATGSPKIILRIITNIIKIKENNVRIIPLHEATESGACEKLIIPSKEY